jgi:hypothetical protein
VLSLPMHPYLDAAMQDRIAAAVKASAALTEQAVGARLDVR